MELPVGAQAAILDDAYAGQIVGVLRDMRPAETGLPRPA